MKKLILLFVTIALLITSCSSSKTIEFQYKIKEEYKNQLSEEFANNTLELCKAITESYNSMARNEPLDKRDAYYKVVNKYDKDKDKFFNDDSDLGKEMKTAIFKGRSQYLLCELEFSTLKLAEKLTKAGGMKKSEFKKQKSDADKNQSELYEIIKALGKYIE